MDCTMLYLFYLLLYYFCSYWLQNRKKGRSPYGLRPYILLYAVRLLNQYMPPFQTTLLEPNHEYRET